jgi:hypothetical protein
MIKFDFDSSEVLVESLMSFIGINIKFKMSFLFRFVRSLARTKSFTKAFNESKASADDRNKKHPLDEWFSSLLSKTNLSAPSLDPLTALKILNI